MKIIKPSFEILEQNFPCQKPDMDRYVYGRILKDEIYRHIERCGRTCYKSEDLITEDSAKPFVDRMINSKHYAMLEHGTVYLTFQWNGVVCTRCNQTLPNKILDRYCQNKYSKVNYYGNDVYITSNLRVLVENNWLDDLQYICEPTEHHEKRYTVRFICNRQVSHEFVRHRVFSFAQESTRYCNYTKDKFGKELTFIQPCWSELKSDLSDYNSLSVADKALYRHLISVEHHYFEMIEAGWKPQQAATILPNALKTELIMTGFAEDWKHFFDLRAKGTTGAPHPQAKELAEPLMNEFIKQGLL